MIALIAAVGNVLGDTLVTGRRRLCLQHRIVAIPQRLVPLIMSDGCVVVMSIIGGRDGMRMPVIPC